MRGNPNFFSRDFKIKGGKKNEKRKHLEYPKVLFYSGLARVFRTTFIGHLYETSQVYPVVLLSEKLDSETEEILRKKELFPKLKEVIPAPQWSGRKINLLKKNRYLYNLAKSVIQSQKPDIVIIPSDLYLFELYLTILAKRTNALTLSVQPSLMGGEMKNFALRDDLLRNYLRMPSFLPFWLRFLLVRCRKYLAHFFYYWILPLLVGQKPFFGKSSYILMKGNSGMKAVDYQLVFSKRERNFYIRDGVPAEKLYILPHPFENKSREFFKKTLFHSVNLPKTDTKTVTLLFPGEEIGFRGENHSLISREEYQKCRIEIVRLVAQILKGWNIFIKPHPAIRNIEGVRKTFESISPNVKVVEPSEPAEVYVEISNVIIGLPCSFTVLFTTSLQCPEKPILALDFYQDLTGDVYKDFDGIEYIDNQEKFIDILGLIRKGIYHKKPKRELEAEGFSSIIELMNHLLKEKTHDKDVISSRNTSNS